MYQPLISISIPIYKCEKHIYKCLLSVKNQLYNNLEIILVNDFTQDNSISIIEDFIVRNPNLKIKLLHHDKNYGLSTVRNTGILNSKGEYIFFLDSDDVITPDCISSLVNCAITTKVDVVVGQNKWINTFDQSEKAYGFPVKPKKKVIYNNHEIFVEYVKDNIPAVSWNKLIKRDFIIENNLFFIPNLYAQDELWMLHLMEKINSLAVVDEITYHYYLHSESVIFNRTKINFENYLTILSYFEISYKKNESKIIKQLIKEKVIYLKNTIILMVLKVYLNDKEYVSEIYLRMKKIIPFKVSDLTDNRLNLKSKKLLIKQNLPIKIGVNWYISRYT
ncbi:glycosyltransferase family 2 protein [Faecalibacter macacae]|uniref:Glycosyltransferase n=1 Tax=Faecalibacter macacae TaxID=1859289 RepID=A0A3L9MQ46_9FLAO|nr:glycosyltransferase [Faecalibacter macacae]RLZ12709.1 glycosyltransferase [Faecalibacter macacae]